VPTDIGTSEGQYLRDLDLAVLLKELADKNLVVTVVLDCCHSGGATRGDAEVRGMDVVDDKPLQPNHEPVAPLETLENTWRSITESGTRGLRASGLPNSGKYVVLAACRQNELAYEYAFNRETRERNGALTYWLLDTLEQQNPGNTYKDLFDRINAKIHSQFPQQTPLLIGEGNRKIFGSELAETVFAIPVLKVEKTEGGITTQAVIGVGQANGVVKGAEFAIYPRSTADFTKKENRVAIARIIDRGATESVCNLEPIQGKQLSVEQGDQAVQISTSVNLVKKVLFDRIAIGELPPEDELPSEIYAQQDETLQSVEAALEGNGWVESATEEDEVGDGIDYQVRLNKAGEYVICDRTGHPFTNINPPIKLSDPSAAEKVVKRLVHLAKYHAAEQLDNMDKDSPLFGKLKVEWLGTADFYSQGDRIPSKSQLQKFADPSKPAVKVDEYIFLLVQNDSSQTLNVAVLDFASDWSIEQIFPGKSENFVTLEAGKKVEIPIPASFAGEDTVKVFATVGQANFRWLELPSLDEVLKPKSGTRSGNPLDALLFAIDEEQPKTRKLSVAASPSREWITSQISLTVVK
jgi:hypothetical protein